MPFTFLAHQAPVLPLKGWRPRWFSGKALVLGSMAPDLEYFLRGRAVAVVGHTALGQLWFCLPLTLALVWVTSRVLAGPLARCLPGPLRDLEALGDTPRTRAQWALAVPSALLGSLSHVLWDAFTHVDGWAVNRVPALSRTAFSLGSREVAWFKVLQHGSTLVGATFTLGVLTVLLRRRSLLAWTGRAPEALSPRAPEGVRRALLIMALVGGMVGALVGLALGGALSDPTRIGRWVPVFLCAVDGGFVALCAACGWSRRSPRGGSRPPRPPTEGDRPTADPS